jgi:hypothetical protein
MNTRSAILSSLSGISKCAAKRGASEQMVYRWRHSWQRCRICGIWKNSPSPTAVTDSQTLVTRDSHVVGSTRLSITGRISGLPTPLLPSCGDYSLATSIRSVGRTVHTIPWTHQPHKKPFNHQSCDSYAKHPGESHWSFTQHFRNGSRGLSPHK